MSKVSTSPSKGANTREAQPSKGQVYKKGSKFIRIAQGGKNPTGYVRNGKVGRFPITAEPVDLTGFKIQESA